MKNKIQTNKKVLICKKVKFLSPYDEEAFFEWIKKIVCIGRYYGSKNEIYLEIVSDTIFWKDIRSIIGLFYRYKVNMKQLSQFLNNDNKKFFYDNKKAFWHEKVFGTNKK